MLLLEYLICVGELELWWLHHQQHYKYHTITKPDILCNALGFFLFV